MAEIDYFKTFGFSIVGTLLFVILYAIIVEIVFKKKPSEKINGLMGIISISIFIFIFYFFYITQLETENAIEQINYNIKSLVDDIIPLISNDTLIIASNEIKEFKVEDLSTEDAKVIESNKNLLIETSIAVGFLLFFSLCYIFYIFTKDKMSPKDIGLSIGQNLVLVLFVGLVEFLFLKFVVKSYGLVDPNSIKRTFLMSLKNVQPILPNINITAPSTDVVRTIVEPENTGVESVNVYARSKNVYGDIEVGVPVVK